jgi:glycosyltransferase involved in cell wall biosynthesis
VPLRIALSALALRPGGSGVQTYIRELVWALPAAVDAEVVVAVQADAVGSLPPAVTPKVFPVAAGARRALLGARSLGPAALVHGLDATLPARVRVPSVVTVHDLAVFDVPWAFSRRRALGRRLLLRHAARAADALIAVSPFTAERLRARLGRDAFVIPEAPASGCVPATAEAIDGIRHKYELAERFVLHVGNIDPRKDLGGLSAACARAGVPLVLAGVPSRSSATDGLRAQLLGYVPPADLNALYGAATMVAYPSRYEGFGLPPLEAMACGAPVVASRVASLPELLGDAALLVTPGDTDELATAIADLVADEDRRRELAGAGMARARRFSWDHTAALTARVYRDLGVSV